MRPTGAAAGRGGGGAGNSIALEEVSDIVQKSHSTAGRILSCFLRKLYM